MNLNINLARDAIVDVIDIAYYLAEAEDITLAERFAEATEEGYKQLAAMPGMGTLRDYGNPANAGMRMWPLPGFPKYLVFYRVVGDELQILHVLHGARDLYAIFAPDEE